MDLRADVQTQIMAQLPFDRTDNSVVAELASLSLSDLLIRYNNWLHRLIQPVPRSVHYSREFTANPIRATHQSALDAIARDIQTGADLTPRLSKGIRHGYVANSSSETPDKDLMLNDWGVHHLHLGINPDPRDPKFIERTSDLLFVIVRPRAAYVLNIFAHQTWTCREIVRIAVSNWPGVDHFLELRGVTAPAGTGYTETEHQELRRSGVAVATSVDGRTFVGRGMLSTAGTSLDSKDASAQLMRKVTNFEDLSANKPDQIAKLLREAGVQPPATPDFEFLFLDHGYGVREKATGAVIVLSD